MALADASSPSRFLGSASSGLDTEQSPSDSQKRKRRRPERFAQEYDRLYGGGRPSKRMRIAEELSDPTLETGENTHTDNNGDLQDNVLGGANGEKVESEDDEALLHSAMGGSAGFNGDGESEIKDSQGDRRTSEVGEIGSASTRSWKVIGLEGVIDEDVSSPEELIEALRSHEETRQQLAASEIRLLAQQERERKLLAEKGVISALVACLHSAFPSVLRHVAGALWNMGVNVANNKAIVAQGAVPPLVALLRHPEPKVQRAAAGAIRCLAWKHETNRAIVAAEGGVSALIALVTSSVAGVQEQACAALWNLGLNRANLPPFTTSLRDIANNSEIITNEGAIKVMIRILDNAHVELQRLAAGVLRCLAYMYEPNRVNIANEGGIVHLCRLLASPSLKVQQQAAAALGNLTYRNAPNRVAVAQDGGIRPLIVLLASKSSEVQLMAATTVRNLALNDENRILIARCGGIPQLVSLLECSKPDIQVQTAAALWNLALNDQNKVLICKAKGLDRLSELMRSGPTDVKYYAKGALFAMGIEVDRPV